MASEGNKWFLGRKTFCLITGASRGLGKVVAIRIAENLGKDSLLLLLARDETALKKTKSAVISGVKVTTRSCDLTFPDFDRYVRIMEEALSENGASAKDYEEIVIIHNAATLGNFKKALAHGENPSEWNNYFSMNLTSPACLNSAFFKVFAGTDSPKLVINVTSFAAIKPHPIISLYCTGKAARNMYFAALAAEEPTITVLNYAPGPLDTEMFHSIINNNKDTFPDLSANFQQIIDDGRILTCEVTTEKMMSILQNGNFASGDHVDYYENYDSMYLKTYNP